MNKKKTDPTQGWIWRGHMSASVKIFSTIIIADKLYGEFLNCWISNNIDLNK